MGEQETETAAIYEDMAAWFTGLHEYIFTTPEFAPLHQLFPVTLEHMSDAKFAARVHVRAVQLLGDSLSSGANSLMIQAIDGFLRKKLFLPSVGSGDAALVLQWAAAIGERGHVTLPVIDADRIADMRRHFEDQIVIPGMHITGEGRCSLEEARADNNIARFQTRTVLTCPHVLEIASDPQVISVVESHLGTIPTILGYSAWWSFADPEEAIESQLFHTDHEDYRFCKLFIYLTDVDEDGGPHVYVEGTHEPDTIAALRRQWADEETAFDDWFFRNFWKDEEQTRHYCGRDPITLTGAAGSCFLVNTRGIHKGLLPRSKDRLICQVLYGVAPRLLEEWDPLRLGTPKGDAVPTSVRRRPLDYVNRFHLA
jgi:hypothetical protein